MIKFSTSFEDFVPTFETPVKFPTRFEDFVPFFEKGFPKLFKSVYTRRILPPVGYMNPKAYAASVCSVIMARWLKLRNVEDRRSHIVAGIEMTIDKLIKFNTPTYFISEDFVRAIAATELPNDFKFNDIKMPLDAMLFCLPVEFSRQYFGRRIPFLAVSHYEVGNYQGYFGRTPIDKARLSMHYPVLLDNNPIVPSEDFGGIWPMEMTVSQAVESYVFQDYATGYTKEYFDIRAASLPVDPQEDKKLSDKATNLLCNILLTINIYPHYIHMGEVARKEKKSPNPKHNQEALWHPNLIGKNYEIQHVTEEHEPTGIKVRTHWRRGHWRWQKYGLNLSLAKRIWIQPILVNG